MPTLIQVDWQEKPVTAYLQRVEDGFVDALTEIIRTAFQLVGDDVAGSFQTGERGYPEEGPLYRQSGSLQDAVKNPQLVAISINAGNAEGILRIKTAGTGGVPHANIQEKGGRIRVTDKMRGLFYHMFQETGDEKWLAMYLSKAEHFEIKPRLGYLDTLAEKTPVIIDMADQTIERLLAA